MIVCIVENVINIRVFNTAIIIEEIDVSSYLLSQVLHILGSGNEEKQILKTKIKVTGIYYMSHLGVNDKTEPFTKYLLLKNINVTNWLFGLTELEEMLLNIRRGLRNLL